MPKLIVILLLSFFFLFISLHCSLRLLKYSQFAVHLNRIGRQNCKTPFQLLLLMLLLINSVKRSPFYLPPRLSTKNDGNTDLRGWILTQCLLWCHQFSKFSQVLKCKHFSVFIWLLEMKLKPFVVLFHLFRSDIQIQAPKKNWHLFEIGHFGCKKMANIFHKRQATWFHHLGGIKYRSACTHNNRTDQRCMYMYMVVLNCSHNRLKTFCLSSWRCSTSTM